MKIIPVLILFLFLTVEGFSQKINRHYSFHPQETGNVYFIHPQSGFSPSDKNAIKNLVYDITYISGRDSASFLFSYYTPNVNTIESVLIVDHQGIHRFEGASRSLFVQPKKSYWEHRAGITIPYDLLVELYQNEQPYTIILKGGKELRYEMKRKKWKKQSTLVSKIFDVVKYNR